MRTKLRGNEQVVMITKKHPLNLILLGAVDLIVLAMLFVFIRSKTAVVVFLIIFAVLLLTLGLMIWVRRRDLWIVTDQRVIDEAGIITIRSDECPLDKINNVSVSQSLLGRILNYGTVAIQTAAEAGMRADFKIMTPREFRSAIFEQQQRARETLAREQGASTERYTEVIAGVTRECPHCAEIIRVRAKVCRFCGRDVESPT